VPRADLLADLGRHVGDVEQALIEEVGPVQAGADDLGSGLRLHDGGEPREHAAHADRLVAHLDAGELLVLGGEGLDEEVVEALDERALVDHGHRFCRGAHPPGSQRGRAAD
jgi:hypothetical protein